MSAGLKTMLMLLAFFCFTTSASGARILQQAEALVSQTTGTLLPAESWQATPEMPKIAVASGVAVVGQENPDGEPENFKPKVSAGQAAMNVLAWQANGGVNEQALQKPAPVEQESQDNATKVDATESKDNGTKVDGGDEEKKESSSELMQDLNSAVVKTPSAAETSDEKPDSSSEEESEDEKKDKKHHKKHSASEVVSDISNGIASASEEFHIKRETMNKMTDIILYAAMLSATLALPVAACTYIYRFCFGEGSRKSID